MEIYDKDDRKRKKPLDGSAVKLIQIDKTPRFSHGITIKPLVKFGVQLKKGKK